MKLFKSIILCGLGVLALSLTSCDDWLDVNVNPDSPSSVATSYDQRLAHIEFYTNSGLQFGAWRTTMAMGDWTRYYNGGNYWHVSYWYPVDAQVTTPYQWWFVGAYANVIDMIEKAEAAENWQFAGVGHLIKAYGYMAMTDLYGEMPYEQAGVDTTATPEYANGKTIYMGCLNDIDIAINYLEKGLNQSSLLPTLGSGNDWWHSGDNLKTALDKWTKLAYLLKARWINKLNKKGAGSYKNGKYDADEILRCLDKAMQSNADNTVINHTDDNGPTHDVLGWDEPVDYSPLFSVCGMNAGYMVTKMLYDNLTNFGGYGVEDPRADHIIPWAYSEKSADSPAEIKWSADGKWRRSLGVDMASDINTNGGPLRAVYATNKFNNSAVDTLNKGKDNQRIVTCWYINSADTARWDDTVYVEETSDCKGYFGNPSILYRRAGSKVTASSESGTFYTRVSSPTYVGTYAECCFIRAEVLFNRGDRAGAYEAYKAGVKASCELMNEKLNVWINEDASLNDCPSFTPMEDAAIENFINTGIGTAGDLTLGHIMTQKRLAMMFSLEIWNDMRRYDFDPNIFFGWSIPAYHYQVVNATKAIPDGKQYRRWRQCSHEYN
ncbi:MAG: SusD/RagB family nutrient-binding outer membrane lipoprotein, partial [Muribaculaceae bacterium]|nr:SusD/RagB family nutrient-binding outer membrane lipoprotein [Muribaculaceae bacterium]